MGDTTQVKFLIKLSLYFQFPFPFLLPLRPFWSLISNLDQNNPQQEYAIQKNPFNS
jgi:hypothetical protein